MKSVLLLIVSLMPLLARAQSPQVKHPRVIEVEEKFSEEVTRYFTRRNPGVPFFVKVDVAPLRRDMKVAGDVENLPYFDYESEENVDEWDDLSTPLNVLRHRVTKVTIDISVPDDFTDKQISEAKEELYAYLKLISFRDEIRVEKKLTTTKPEILPPYFFQVGSAILGLTIILGLMLRWGIGGLKNSHITPVASAPQASAAAAPAASSSKARSSSNTAVSGDVTFHDPLKTMDIVHVKVEAIKRSGTFPTLKDIMTLNEFGLKNSAKLGGVIYEMPSDWQKIIFGLGNGEHWLEAFANPGGLDHDSLFLLDRLSRDRHFQASDRGLEDLLIQIWRMGDRSITFLKRLEPDHAFFILNMLPKSFSLGIAKKAFPGGWGRLLENRPSGLLVDAGLINTWTDQLFQAYPKNEWKVLESYKKDREILQYLDIATIEEEKEIYETLHHDSFVFSVRPPFYKIFELPQTDFMNLISAFPLEKWGLVVINSSRSYMRQISDVLEDKKKMVFSNHLKQLDSSVAMAEQSHWRRTIAQYASENYSIHLNTGNEKNDELTQTA